MKEYTTTMNAQLTFIYKSSEDDEYTEEEIVGIDAKKWASLISAVFGFANVSLDDVVVTDVKTFIRDEEESENESQT